MDEVKDVIDKAEAMAAYGRQSENTTLEADATVIRRRAERRLGEMIIAEDMPLGRPKARPPEIEINGSTEDPFIVDPPDDAPVVDEPLKPTLEEILGKRHKHIADRARKAAKLSKEAFEAKLAEERKQIIEETRKRIRGTEGTGENEWYTPPAVIERARAALGEIDLDPASSAYAQGRVKANAYFTKDDSGLVQEWHGRVWLNPPYAQPLIAHFVTKMVAEVEAKHVDAAIMLTHNYTDSSWFHLAANACQAICFTRGRIKFEQADGTVAAPTQGQAFFYFGPDVAVFRAAFADVAVFRAAFADVGFVVTKGE
jgi:ParB family chromosome partitioning protein